MVSEYMRITMFKKYNNIIFNEEKKKTMKLLAIRRKTELVLNISA